MSAKYSVDDNCWMMKDNKAVEVIIRASVTHTFKESEKHFYIVMLESEIEHLETLRSLSRDSYESMRERYIGGMDRPSYTSNSYSPLDRAIEQMRAARVTRFSDMPIPPNSEERTRVRPMTEISEEDYKELIPEEKIFFTKAELLESL